MARPEAAPPLDVYLVGTAYSGTTHLGGLLSANFGSLYAGELGRLPHYVEQFGLFTDPLGCLRCAGTDEPCPVWTDTLVAEIEQASPPRAMRRLRERLETPVIVDGSKLPAWLQTTLNGRDCNDARVVVLLTTRSPLSYAMSAIGATSQPLWLALREWRDIYIDALRTATRSQLPIFVVRNEEVRTDPGTVLDRLAPLLGWPRRVREVLPAEPTHSIGGNAFVQGGYGSGGQELLERTGLIQGATWNAVTREAVAEAASVGALQRPTDQATARQWVQAVIDCPGLVETAQTLGYEMQIEFERFIAAAQ